jgi:AhpD family alkylhydroperoxidase
VKVRLNYAKAAPGVYDAMDALDQYLATCGLPDALLHLVRLRASQINGCAYCIDMHWKDLRALGENEQRLYGLDAWRESPYYDDRERAALAWTEAVTLIADGQAPDAIWEQAKPHFSDKEMADLTLAVVTINAWNRLSIAARLTPGTYQPAKTGS